MRVVFLGTPDFAVPSLRALAGDFAVVGVVTQPDRPAGRGQHRQAPPAKAAAIELGLPVLQPERVRTAEAVAAIADCVPDVIVVAAYGQILSAEILAIPPNGCVNVHASLLPRWRGASPIQAAIIEGDAETGVSIMKMDEGMDTGPVLAQIALPIRGDHTGGSLSAELAALGAQLLLETLPIYLAGRITPIPQDNRRATLAPRLKRSDAALDPSLPANRLERRVRAFSPSPGASIAWGEIKLRVLASHVLPGRAAGPGTVIVRDGAPMMATGDGFLALDVVQRPGGRPIPGRAFLAGHRGLEGAMLEFRP